MWQWIIISMVYALAFGGFRLLGGMGAAAQSVQTWGQSSTTAGLRSS